MPRFDVTTIGEGQLRYSVPPGQRLERATQLDVRVSCTEANVASLLARLGWRCGWVTSLPTTPLGRRVANELMLSGLDLAAIVWTDKYRLATYYVEYAVPPRATEVYFDRANTCFTNLMKEQIAWDYLLDTRLLHLSGLTVPLSPSLGEIVQEAVRRANAKKIAISFDVNYRRRVWTPEQAREILAPILKDVTILFCSRGDANQVFGIEGEPQEIASQLGALTGAGYIVTSLSSEGLIGWDRREFYRQPAREVVILDRIGAGDAMVGGVLYGWLQNDFAKGIRYGALTAALALSQYGDQVITTRDEVETLLDAIWSLCEKLLTKPTFSMKNAVLPTGLRACDTHTLPRIPRDRSP
ncbi:MAG: sugar kinase [Chloroflexi bacterium]|nr:sugar kinase [Chloroflexota bacterium]